MRENQFTVTWNETSCSLAWGKTTKESLTGCPNDVLSKQFVFLCEDEGLKDHRLSLVLPPSDEIWPGERRNQWGKFANSIWRMKTMFHFLTTVHSGKLTSCKLFILSRCINLKISFEQYCTHLFGGNPSYCEKRTCPPARRSESLHCVLLSHKTHKHEKKRREKTVYLGMKGDLRRSRERKVHSFLRRLRKRKKSQVDTTREKRNIRSSFLLTEIETFTTRGWRRRCNCIDHFFPVSRHIFSCTE